MFFKKNKNERKSRLNRAFKFTDKECREMCLDEGEIQRGFSDELCPNLYLIASSTGNHTFSFRSGKGGSKAIGSVFAVSVKEAREIVNNIKDNLPEFLAERNNIKMPMSAYFKKYGMYPHKPKGTEVIISDENASLKKKIKDLEEEVARLNRMIAVYNARLDSIADYARSPLPTDDEKVIDVFGED